LGVLSAPDVLDGGLFSVHGFPSVCRRTLRATHECSVGRRHVSRGTCMLWVAHIFSALVGIWGRLFCAEENFSVRRPKKK